MMPLLSTLIGLPLVGAILVSFLRDHDHWARLSAVFISIISLVLSGWMWSGFDASSAAMQWVEQYAWVPTLGLTIRLGVDGITMPLVALTSFINVIILLMSWHLVQKKVSQYLAVFLILQAMTIGVFCALDGILFYLFWEGMLIPMYICIGLWGGENRTYAAIKFFSTLFLVRRSC